MNKYFLYLEIVDDEAPHDVIERELIDIHEAESIEECLKETEWSGGDVMPDEQYGINEISDGWDLGWYYPFGEAKIVEKFKKIPKYSNGVMRNVRQALGVEPDDTSLDVEINEMDQMEVLDKWLQWEGIFGYTYSIKDAVDNIFYRK